MNLKQLKVRLALCDSFTSHYTVPISASHGEADARVKGHPMPLPCSYSVLLVGQSDRGAGVCDPTWYNKWLVSENDEGVFVVKKRQKQIVYTRNPREKCISRYLT